MSKKILVIVKGEKKEPEIMSRVLDAYSLSNREIVSYMTFAGSQIRHTKIPTAGNMLWGLLYGGWEVRRLEV